MTAQTEELDRLLRGLTSKMRKAFLDAVAKLGDKIDVKALEELLRAGRVNEAINVVSAAAVISGFRPLAVEATYSTIFAARAAADAAAKIADLVRHDIVFDQTETEALDYLRRNEMNLIRETSAQALASIRATIIAGQTAGRNPRDTARDVRDFIGLTSRQTQAVLNYRSALENQQADALNRALRDRRFDSTAARAFNAGEPLPPEKIDAMVGRYRDRYLKYRAETIARTECLPADTLVDAAMVRAIFRRPYDGDMIDIVTNDGHHISATPNHPMLTQRGWVGAAFVDDADYLICDARQKNPGAPSDDHMDRAPSEIGEIFDALSNAAVTKREPGSRLDFHGDGSDADVDVIRPNGGLMVGEFAALDKPLMDRFLSSSHFASFRFCPLCAGLLPINPRHHLCLGSQLSAMDPDHPSDRALVDAEFFAECNEGFASLVSHRDLGAGEIVLAVPRPSAILEKPFSGLGRRPCNPGPSYGGGHKVSTKARSLGNGPGAESGSVKLNRVKSVSRRIFRGHVFNLSTDAGYFTIDGGAYTGNSLRAANGGAQLAWQQQVSAGKVDAQTVTRFWHHAHDGRVREAHIQIPLMNPDGVGLNEPFQSPLGPIMYPGDPAAPLELTANCRCVLTYRLSSEALRQAA